MNAKVVTEIQVKPQLLLMPINQMGRDNKINRNGNSDERVF